jgi:heptosyltransferase-2
LIKQAIKNTNVLVIQPLPGIGDTIWHLPHLKAIADNTFSQQITLLTKRRSLARDLLAGTNYIKEVLYLSEAKNRHGGIFGGWKLGSDLKPYHFDETWILHGSTRYGIAASYAGIKERFGYGIGWQDAFLTSPYSMSRKDNLLGTIEKATRCLELNGIPFYEQTPRLILTKEAIRSAKSLLTKSHRRTIGLAIGSSELSKQWGPKKFISLIRSIREKHDVQIVLVGGPSDTNIANLIAKSFSFSPWLKQALGRPILEAAAVTSLCEICVGNDTGILNIAAATGTISIGLFGASNPQNRNPFITAIVPSEIRIKSGNGMDMITPTEVLKSIHNITSFQ